MKKATTSLLWVCFPLISGLFLLSFSISGQEISKVSPPLPDNVNKIVTSSCTPCHTNQGKLLSRVKLNFSEWSQYSPDKQKVKAEKMYSLLEQGDMPPKSVSKTRPEIIPTKDQIDIIKKWADSLKVENK